MFWFTKSDGRALFMDKRKETVFVDRGTGATPYVIKPNILADFSFMPFSDNTFALVVFDPPHIIRTEARGNFTKMYGILNNDWKDDIRRGFAECFRVLRPNGVLIFKWSESEIPLSNILALTLEQPLFGNRSGKIGKTHWIVFMKSSRRR